MSEPDEVEPARIDGEAVDGRVDVTPVGAGAPLDEDQPALRLSIRTDDGAGTVAVELSSADAVALVDEINAELERLQEAAR